MSRLRGALHDPLLSVVMPVFNELQTVEEVIRRVLAVTAKIFRRKLRVYEVPISYDGRGYDEGKKVGWRDGVVAVWVLLKYRFGE